MRLSIRHETRYDYSAPLHYALQSLCLTPQASEHQTVHQWLLAAPGPLFARRDGYGNLAHTWNLAGRAQSGAVRAQGVVETHGVARLLDSAVAPQIYLRPTALTASSPAIAALAQAALGSPQAAGSGIDCERALRLAAEIVRRMPYRPQHTHVGTSAAEALELQGGVCQDHAHVFVAACRAHGLAARYVSGYFHAPEARHLASHAWADVCLDLNEARWLSIDITHLCLMDERHVRLAVGPDYAACPPVRGVREGGGDETLQVRIDIQEQAPSSL